MVGAGRAHARREKARTQAREESVVRNNRALMPVLAGLGAAAVGVVVYAFSGRRPSSAPLAGALEELPERASGVVPRDEGPRAEVVDLRTAGALPTIGDLPMVGAGVELDANEPLSGDFLVEDGLEELTVQPDVKVPALASADDAEPPSPDDLGSFWLSGATQSERSLTEQDLQPDIEALADLRELEDEPDLDEDEAQDQALAAVERRGS